MTTPYASRAEVVEDSVRWTVASLMGLINEGRTAGWIEGAPMAQPVTAPELRELIARRLALTPASLEVTPVHWRTSRRARAARSR